MPEEPVTITEVQDPPQPQKHEFRYQPAYPEGHELAGQPMGGEQVIEYDGSTQDLGNKMVENNNRLQAELRKVKARVSMKETEEDEEFQKAPKRSERVAAINPRDLTPEEAMEFTRGIVDPTRAQQVLDNAIAARLGASPERLRQLDSGIQQTQDWIEGNKFRQLHPVEAGSPEVRKALLQWCDDNDKDYTCANFELALKRLKRAGLLPSVPIAAEATPPKTQEEPETEEPVDSGEPRREPSRRPVTRTSTLGARSAPGSAPRAPAAAQTVTRAEFEKMPLAEVQRRAQNEVWKKAANLVIRQIPNVELMQLLKRRDFEQKVNALG